MARKIVKIPNITTRQVMYSKRRSGLIKKVYELSVLSEIDCALIMFSPAGKLCHFSNRRIEDVLMKFLNSGEEELTKLSIPNKEGLMVLLENIKTQDMANEAHSQHENSSSNLLKGCCNYEGIRKELSKLEIRLDNLKTIESLVGDLRKPVHCPLELEERDWALQKCLHQVTKRKNYLLRKSGAPASSSLPITVQQSEGNSFPQDRNLESLQLADSGSGATGFRKKENASTLEHKFESLQLTHNGGATGFIKEEDVSTEYE